MHKTNRGHSLQYDTESSGVNHSCPLRYTGDSILWRLEVLERLYFNPIQEFIYVKYKDEINASSK